MKWFHYVSRHNEIFCDLDSRRALSRAYTLFALPETRRILKPQSCWTFPSESHYHVVVVLHAPMKPALRALWAEWLGSDKLRAMLTQTRIQLNVPSPDVLITPFPWSGWSDRKPDAWCVCPRKHVPEISKDCPALLKLRGAAGMKDYFPVWTPKPVAFGRMTIQRRGKHGKRK